MNEETTGASAMPTNVTGDAVSTSNIHWVKNRMKNVRDIMLAMTRRKKNKQSTKYNFIFNSFI